MQTVGQGRISGKNRLGRQGPQDEGDPFRKPSAIGITEAPGPRHSLRSPPGAAVAKRDASPDGEG